ncbi:S8 family serine peptidase [candidate division KSB1 bacterium]|nr:S8 family serine peptidase [candidate division KSB1 bacterium]
MLKLFSSRIFITVLVVMLLFESPVLFGRDIDFSNNLQNVSKHSGDKYLPGILIVKVKPSLDRELASGYFKIENLKKSTATSVFQNAGVTAIEKIFPRHERQISIDKIDLSRIYRIRLAQNMNVPYLAQKLRTDPQIEYAEPEYLRKINFVPNDSLYYLQWHLQKVQADKAWDREKGNSKIIIGIVDTGTDIYHPDLQSKIWKNEDEIPNNGIDDDNNGRIDDVNGWDFAEKDNNPVNTSSSSRAAHGSLTAGVAAAATNNRIGVAGIGYNSTIMPIKCSLDYPKDAEQYIISGFEGIKYAADNGARIISCSWGGSSFSDFELEVVRYVHEKGAVIVAAAGNSYAEKVEYPASYPYVISVAATDQKDQKADFSTYGITVDLAAPGTSIFTTWGYNEGYDSAQGTSFSTPLVAGAIALVLANHPEWNAEQAAQQVRISADDIYPVNPTFRYKLGKGRLNAFQALNVVSPSIRLDSFVYSDRTYGDNDGVMDPGEKIELIFHLHNYLANATNVSVKLTTDDPYIQWDRDQITINQIPSQSIHVNDATPFIITVKSNAPRGHLVECFVDITADGGYQDWEFINLIIAPLFATHNIGNVAFTLTSFGAFGYKNYVESDELYGEGFQYPKGSISALFHGSLVVGDGPNRVSDCAYGNSTKNYMDWSTTVLGNLVFGLKEKSDQDSYAQFDDQNAINPIGVTVTQRSYSWTASPDDDYVILEFDVQNTRAELLDSLYVGLYMDWDIGPSNDNEADFDVVNALGYQYTSVSKYYGISLITPEKPASFRAVENERYVWPDTYPDKLRWQFLTEGFIATKSSRPHDWSQMLSAGPFRLEKFAKTTVTFAVLGGENLDDLILNAQAAKSKYHQIADVNDFPEHEKLEFQLYSNYPNPFNPSTTIRFQMAQAGLMRLNIYNINGQLVRTLLNHDFPAGMHSVRWDGLDELGNSASSGVYLVKFESANYQQSRKLILIR